MIARVALAFLLLNLGAAAKSPPHSAGPTFNRDIAPIIFSQCVDCHHPGGDAPFSLTTYAEVKKRAGLIARLVTKRTMPPWMPEPGHGEFMGARRLSDEQITLLEQWAKRGAPEGAPADLKVTPKWSDGWRLGEPDLVITLPKAYTLPPDGKDVYRNFVITGAIPGLRYLRAAEFRPGNTTAIHHAFILLENTGQARRTADPSDNGFDGMSAAGASAPEGMFMSWQPGKQVSEAPPGVAATLQKSTDFVIQLHMRPTGKPEQVQPTVGLYFAKEPPTRAPFIFMLRSVELDIPAGATDYAIESSYELPVDADLISVLPHLHYLGKEVRAWATLPDGTRRELLFIKEWDFNWQGDYRYAEPVVLPKGTTVSMRYTYDNSEANPRNPNQPPRRVTYGLESADEMGELWLQLIPRNASERDILRQDVVKKVALPDAIAWANAMLRKNPKDAARRTSLATALIAKGEREEALRHLEQAIADDPKHARAHYLLGSLHMDKNDVANAKAALQRAVELDPENSRAQNDFGWVLVVSGEVDRSLMHFWKAIELNPNDPLPRANLDRARSMLPPRK